MANLQLPAGIGLVSGTLSKKSIRTSTGTVTRRVIAKVVNGKQKLYIREDQPRLSKLTDAEIATRSSFSRMAAEVARRINAGDTRPRKLIWADVKADFKKGGSPCK